jgi:hypothetical protein
MPACVNALTRKVRYHTVTVQSSLRDPEDRCTGLPFRHLYCQSPQLHRHVEATRMCCFPKVTTSDRHRPAKQTPDAP